MAQRAPSEFFRQLEGRIFTIAKHGCLPSSQNSEWRVMTCVNRSESATQQLFTPFITCDYSLLPHPPSHSGPCPIGEPGFQHIPPFLLEQDSAGNGFSPDVRPPRERPFLGRGVSPLE